eukprot:7385192-Prymnesium_polylepis.2
MAANDNADEDAARLPETKEQGCCGACDCGCITQQIVSARKPGECLSTHERRGRPASIAFAVPSGGPGRYDQPRRASAGVSRRHAPVWPRSATPLVLGSASRARG